jgi:hypothetical protein
VNKFLYHIKPFCGSSCSYHCWWNICLWQIANLLISEITFPKIKIIADAGLQPVDKMMVSVTKPLEAAIKQVPDLQIIRSTTSRGVVKYLHS